MNATRLIICFSFLILSGHVTSQKVLWSDYDNPQMQGLLRKAFYPQVSGIGDINGDGAGDIVVGRLYPHPAQPKVNAGVLEFRSGRTGSVIHWIYADAHSVAPAGDVNKDGVPDLIVGTRGRIALGGFTALPGSVTVYSGKDGSVIHSWTADDPFDDRFGWHVAGGGDVNRDGYPDYIVAGRGNAILFSGKDGSILHRFPAGGRSIILGDVNGDGHADLALADSQADNNGVNSGSVWVVSGKNKSTIYRLDGQLSGPYGSFFGHSLAVLGDVDRDGVPDFAVSATCSPKFWSGYSGSIEIFSGRSGRRLLLLEGNNPGDRFGWFLRAVGDTNGDGISEFMDASGCATGRTPDRKVLLSHTGQVLWSYFRDLSGEFGPVLGSVAGLGDVDGDGLGDLAICLYRGLHVGPVSRGIEVHAPFGTVPLRADKSMLSLSRGENLVFWLDGGRPMANQWYALLGSMTWSQPGIQIGLVRLLLNPDIYFQLTLGHGGGLHQYPLGRLDSLGRMNSTFKLDPRFPTELIGLKLYHSFLGFSLTPPWIYFASNVVETEIGT